jgi:uncharacterized protein YbaA (DUF1428 family)
MALVTEIYSWIDYWETQFQDAADLLGYEREMVFYGDQDRIPGYPAICLEPDNTGYSEPSQTYLGRKTIIDLSFFILVYHGEVRDPQVNRRDADVLAKKCVDLIHSHHTGEGRVIYCWASSVTSGYATKAGTPVRASRISVSATTQEQLPLTP